MDIINGRIPPFITFLIFSLALTNAAASIHSANIRGRLASSIQVDQDAAADFLPSSFTLSPTTNTRHLQRAVAAIMETDIVVREEDHDQSHEQPQPLTVAAASTGASKPCNPKTKTKTNTGAITTFKPNANWVPLPTGIPASPPPVTTTLTITPSSTTTKQQPAPAPPTTTHPSSSSSFNPQASCMLAIFSLISNIPTPGPSLSTALEKAKHVLAPSAVAAPQCTITLPASLSSEYGVYTSRVDSWVSQHSMELDKLDSVCEEKETGREKGRSVTDVVHGTTTTATGQGQGCTAPVAVFTGGVTSGNTTAKATSTKSGTTGVGTSTKMGTVTTTTVTTSSTSSITGSATTVAGPTSSQPTEGSKVGGAARVTGVMAVVMVVAGLLAVVVVV